MSPGTPQKNGVVEQVFDTAYYRMRTIMAHTVIHGKLSTELWFECVATKKKSKYYGKPIRKKCAHEKFYGKIPDYAKYLSSLGEIGSVCSVDTIKEKLQYRGNNCMLLGYAQNITSGTYQMFNIRIKRIVLRCNVIWINKTFI